MDLIKEYYERQNKTYQSKFGYINSTLAVHSRAFKDFFLVTYFLEEFKVLDKFNVEKKINVLEAGCGIGFISKYLSTFAKDVYAFDNSEEGINQSRKNNAEFRNINHFVGDGLDLDSIKNIQDQKFDFIFLREFHPVSRNFFNNSKKNMSVLDSYIKLLKPNGIIIINHADNPSTSLNFEDLPRNYKSMFIGTYFPNFLIILLLIFRYNFRIASPIASFMSSILFIFLKSPLKFAVLQKRS